MQYPYTAKTDQGNLKSGVIEASSIIDARRRLREEGLFPLTVGGSQGERTTAARKPLFGRTGVRKTDILTLTSQLSIMCQTGVDLAEALQTVATQCSNPAFKKILTAVYEDVSNGQRVSTALRRQAHVFGHAYVASVAAAESSGTITEVLARLTELLRNEIQLRSSLRSVLAYPIVLGSVALLVLGALVFFVLPQFSEVFTEMGAQPPPMTQLLMTGANMLREYFLLVLISFACGLFALVRFWFSERGTRYWDGVFLNAMLIRKATQPLLLGRIFRLLGTMLQSGIPLLEAIQLGSASIQNKLYLELFQTLESKVINGEGLSNALATARFVPPEAAQMIMTAERTGRIGVVMESVGEFYEEEGVRQVQQLAKLLEPMIIVFMGVIVTFVVLAIMLPLLDVSTMSH